MLSIYNEGRIQKWFNATVVCGVALGNIPEPYDSRFVDDPQTYFSGFMGYVRRRYHRRLIDESRLKEFFLYYIEWLKEQDRKAEEEAESHPDLY